MKYIDAIVAATPNPIKLTTVSKVTICDWIKAGLDYLQQNKSTVKKAFLVCGMTNSLDGSENGLIRCAKELPTLQLPYVNESSDDLF